MKTHAAKFLAVLSFLLLCGISQGSLIHYSALLNGANEAPPNASSGIGTADVFYNDSTHMMEVVVSFSGLTGTVTASHIHAGTAAPDTGTAGVATMTPTFLGFPGGVSSGTYDHTFDMTLASSYNSSFITANGGTTASAEAALFSFMSAGRTYLNIHSSVVPGGEIRGFLHSVPEASSTIAMLGGALAGLALLRRRLVG